jgi:uncharacterized ubiquitin-like protein YukD
MGVVKSDDKGCGMALVKVQIWDATATKRQDVEMPDDAPINRILAVLLEKMNFPQYAPDGQPLSYKFHHKASGKQLMDHQCLSDLGVKSGDVLRLQPEITAGQTHVSPGHISRSRSLRQR